MKRQDHDNRRRNKSSWKQSKPSSKGDASMYKTILALIALTTATSAYARDIEACSNALHSYTVVEMQMKSIKDKFDQVSRDVQDPKLLTANLAGQYVELIDEETSYVHRGLENLTYLRDHYECGGDDKDFLTVTVRRAQTMERALRNLNDLRSIYKLN
jgi:hypothetical protein